MGKIYKNQSNVRIKLDTGIELTAVLDAQIKYIKPNGITGHWDASVDGNNVYYDFTEKLGGGSELDIAGSWKVWAYIIFQDGRKAPGEASFLKIHEEGT